MSEGPLCVAVERVLGALGIAVERGSTPGPLCVAVERRSGGTFEIICTGSDGNFWSYGATWAAVRGGTGEGLEWHGDDPNGNVQTTRAGGYYMIGRDHYVFDTRGISGTIISAMLYVWQGWAGGAGLVLPVSTNGFADVTAPTTADWTVYPSAPAVADCINFSDMSPYSGGYPYSAAITDLSHIVKGGYTGIGLMSYTYDRLDVPVPGMGYGVNRIWTSHRPDYMGEVRPKLVVVTA